MFAFAAQGADDARYEKALTALLETLRKSGRILPALQSSPTVDRPGGFGIEQCVRILRGPCANEEGRVIKFEGDSALVKILCGEEYVFNLDNIAPVGTKFRVGQHVQIHGTPCHGENGIVRGLPSASRHSYEVEVITGRWLDSGALAYLSENTMRAE